MSRRLGIFVFYDASGIVDRYVESLLQGLSKELGKLVIIVNGYITENSEACLKKFSQYVYIRENKGYDGGGYKDAFLRFLTKEPWQEWDEVALFNDTFFAPIFPWEKVFATMENEAADFWGLTLHPGGVLKTRYEKGCPCHVQSYFLVCRKKMMMSKAFFTFWEEMEYPETYEDAVVHFEISFTTWFCQCGFRYSAYMNVCKASFKVNDGTNPYLDQADELLKKMEFPVVKRRLFTAEFWDVAEKAVKYIEEASDYDITQIFAHVQRLDREGRTRFGFWKLEQFYHAHDRIYIWGYGRYGKSIAKYFDYRGWRVEKFIVSEKKVENPDVCEYEDIVFLKGDGVVLALGDKNCREVYEKIRGQALEEEQLFLPNGMQPVERGSGSEA